MQNWYSCLLSSSRWWVSILSIIIYVKKISQIWRCNRNIHVHLTFFFVARWNEIASTFFMFRWSVCTHWAQTTLTRPSTSLTASSSSDPFSRSSIQSQLAFIQLCFKFTKTNLKRCSGWTSSRVPAPLVFPDFELSAFLESLKLQSVCKDHHDALKLIVFHRDSICTQL